MTLKYIWRSFSLGCHFRVHFSYPWHAFASHGLPVIAELLVLVIITTIIIIIIIILRQTLWESYATKVMSISASDSVWPTVCLLGNDCWYAAVKCSLSLWRCHASYYIVRQHIWATMRMSHQKLSCVFERVLSAAVQNCLSETWHRCWASVWNYATNVWVTVQGQNHRTENLQS